MKIWIKALAGVIATAIVGSVVDHFVPAAMPVVAKLLSADAPVWLVLVSAALAVVAGRVSAHPIQVAPHQEAVPEVALSRAESAMIFELSRLPHPATEDELINLLSQGDKFTGPQISAALRSLLQRGFADRSLIEFEAHYRLTQLGFDLAEAR